MTELRRRMDEDMVVRGMADRTRETYLWAVAALARFYRRPPDQISDEEIQAYLLHLMHERHRAWSTCNIVVHALRFFYHTTLKRDRTTFCIPTSRQPSRLPALLSRAEVQQLLAAATQPTHRVMLLTAYAAGLRLNELVHLRVSDIDSARMTIRVEQGKGGKDRSTVLSASLLEALRGHGRQRRPTTWLFPGRAGRPMDRSGVQRAYTVAKRRAGITKPGLSVRTATPIVRPTRILHTWGQNLSQHLHLHCVVTGGALAPDGTRWIAAKDGFLFPVRALSTVFRAKYLDALQQAFAAKRLTFASGTADLAAPDAFARFVADLRTAPWIVYAMRPFGGPAQVLQYLGRYTHRVAISNARLVDLHDGTVRFCWKDYADHDRTKVLALSADEFLRRFLLHIVPRGFVRIRDFGLLANRRRHAQLDRCRVVLAAPPPAAPSAESPTSIPGPAAALRRCPHCGVGTLRVITVPASRSPPAHRDTS